MNLDLPNSAPLDAGEVTAVEKSESFSIYIEVVNSNGANSFLLLRL